jgi:hypothetical protein
MPKSLDHLVQLMAARRSPAPANPTDGGGDSSGANGGTEVVPDPPWVEAVARIALALVGVGLIVTAIWLWASDEGTTVSSKDVTTTISKRQAAGRKGSRGHHKPKAFQPVRKTSKRTTTVSGPRKKGKHEHAPQSVSRRSETVTTTLLGLGAILLLVAGLYRRLSKLKLPGVGELEFAAVTRPTPQDAAKLAAAAQRKAAETGGSPVQLAAAGLVQLEEEKRQAVVASAVPDLAAKGEGEGEGIYPMHYLVSATSPGDDYFDGVIDRARESFE